MNPNQALWEKGDFTRIAESMSESGEELARKLGVTKGLKVLDLGCGDGKLGWARMYSESISPGTLSRPEISARKKQGLRTASFRKARPQTSAILRTPRSISSSAS